MTTQNSTSTTTDGQQPGDGTPSAAGAASATEEHQAAQQQGQRGTEGTEAAEDGEGGNSEAAKRRRQLRETESKLRDTESERDTLTGTVDALRKQIVASNMPHGAKLNADALWTAGHNPADFFTEDGAIDVDKVTAAAKDTHQKFGVRFGPDPIPASGTGQGSASQGDGPSWSKVMNRSKR